MRSFTLASISLAISLAFSTSAYALPGNISTAHPRLYAAPSDIEQLKGVLRLDVPSVLPKKFTVQFSISTALKVAGDEAQAVLFGNADSMGTNAIFLRHVDEYDTADSVGLQLGLLNNTGYAANAKLMLKLSDQPTTVTLSYDDSKKTVTLLANGQAIKVNYNTNGFNWTPARQLYHFVARKGDAVTGFTIRNDETGEILWQRDRIDYELGTAYFRFIREAKNYVAAVNACDLNSPSSVDGSVCNVATGSRNVILTTAKQLGLAYKMTGDTAFRDAAARYASLIMAMDSFKKFSLTSGDQTSMSARVAALGVIYDWFHDELGDNLRANIRSKIVQTIRAHISGDAQDLIRMTCGGAILLLDDKNKLDCAGTPDLSRSYIQSVEASAMTGTALGLLAIVEDSLAEQVDVRPMLDRIYTHLVNGLIPAREYISVDGGHHTLFAYGSTAGEMIERLFMWRRVLSTSDGSPIAPTSFESKVIQPFIYALRADGGFPAEGDNFDVTADMEYVGYAALAASHNGDGFAATFYRDNVKGLRKWASSQQIWDQLYFPGVAAAPAAISDLPLAARFRVAGNVFMRDSWDYANSTLLDFKSTSFISEVHQHLDQNSFSVFRHQPLLVDSGAYDAYASAHWNNYYSRTIAHNSIVVFDKSEQFKTDNDTFSNDGGQWRKPTQERYPRLAEIQSKAYNGLDGVTYFENGPDYSFVTGNASKAYSAKLDQADGFLRSIVYLRPAVAGGKTTILVFDRVHAPGKLAATSLLHFAQKPSVHAVSTVAEGGRLKLQPKQHNFPLLARNGRGMVTVEPLLPDNARITLVGAQPGVRCDQVPSDSSQPVIDTDCSFTVRRLTGPDTFTWTNFATKADFNVKRRADFGTWRMEISEADEGALASSEHQWFLNVLHVEDQRAEADPVSNSAVLLDSTDSSTAAVAVDADRMVVFAKSSAAASSLRWKAGSDYKGTILAAGLLPQTAYVRSYDATKGEIVLTATATADNTVLRSSSEGVLSLPAR